MATAAAAGAAACTRHSTATATAAAAAAAAQHSYSSCSSSKVGSRQPLRLAARLWRAWLCPAPPSRTCLHSTHGSAQHHHAAPACTARVVLPSTTTPHLLAQHVRVTQHHHAAPACTARADYPAPPRHTCLHSTRGLPCTTTPHLLAQHARVAQHHHAKARACQRHVEAARVAQEAHALLLIGAHAGQHNHVLLSALQGTGEACMMQARLAWPR